MKTMRGYFGLGLVGAVFCLVPEAVWAFQAEDDVIREGDLREADHAAPGSWEHVDELASDLEQLAKDLHDEVHLHLEGHIFFHHMDGHAEEIEALAGHIHDLAHKGKSIKHLRADVIGLDEQVHHADEVITKIARHGVVAVHYDGAVRQTRRIVKSMNEILHHLEADLRQLDPDFVRGHRHETLRPGVVHPPLYRRPSEEYHHTHRFHAQDSSPYGHRH